MQVSAHTGVPMAWLLAIDEREGGGNSMTYFGNGEHVIGNGKKTTLVPIGRGPFADWQAGCIDALQYDGEDQVSLWTISRAIYQAEAWNGFGPRNHGRYSGYLWSGTNIYNGGKYTSDNHWDPTANDQQLGVVPVMLRLAQIDSSLTLPNFPIPVPLPPPEAVSDAMWLQQALNSLGQAPPLIEDGNYGRKTRAAVKAFQAAHRLTPDGLAGPNTRAVIVTAMGIEA